MLFRRWSEKKYLTPYKIPIAFSSKTIIIATRNLYLGVICYTEFPGFFFILYFWDHCLWYFPRHPNFSHKKQLLYHLQIRIELSKVKLESYLMYNMRGWFVLDGEYSSVVLHKLLEHPHLHANQSLCADFDRSKNFYLALYYMV